MPRDGVAGYDPESPASRDALLPGLKNIAEERAAARVCKACRLWKKATQTVFGEGDKRARIVIVGEQPGDKAAAYLQFVKDLRSSKAQAAG